MAEEDRAGLASQEQVQDIENIKQRISMLDQRLDNIDSVVTAVVERVMKQPITINVTCPKCGEKIEIGLIGSEKPTR